MKIFIEKESVITILKIVTLLTIIMGCNSNILMLIALGISACCTLFLDMPSTYTYMFLLLPFANIFKLEAESSSLFTYIGLLLVIRVVFSIRRIEKKILLSYFIFLGMIVLGCSWNFTLLIKQLSIPVLVYGYFKLNGNYVKNILCNWSIGSVVASLIAEYHEYFPGVSVYIKNIRVYEVSSDVYRFTGLYSDPNYYAATLILIIIGLLILLKNKNIKNHWYIIVGALIFFGIETVSKSFFLMLIIVSGMYFVLILKNREYVKILIILVGILVILQSEIVQQITIFDMVIERLKNGDITTGRVKIWNDYIQALLNHPLKLLVGYGIGSPILYLHAPHNTYIESIYYYGLLGSVNYVLCLFFIVGNKKIRDIMCVLPMFCFFILAFFLGYIQTFDFPYLLILTCGFLKYEKTQYKINGNSK